MDSSLQTLPQRLRARASETPDDIAYLRLSAQGEWLETRWCEVLEHVDALAANLLELGLRHGDRVVIMMPTSPLWEYCQLAILSVGGIVIGLDAHDAPRNIRHILELTQPRLVFTGSAEQLALISANWMRPEISIVASGLDANTPALDLDSLFKPCGKAVQCPAPAPDQIATIVFTSGSTGQPKGIEYSHRQVLAACDQILQRFPGIGPDARLACWLPLSNLFQRMINFCALSCGARSYFVDRPDQIAQLLPHIAPSFFIGVPRFFEKLHAGIVRTMQHVANDVRRFHALGCFQVAQHRSLHVGTRLGKRTQGNVPCFFRNGLSGSRCDRHTFGVQSGHEFRATVGGDNVAHAGPHQASTCSQCGEEAVLDPLRLRDVIGVLVVDFCVGTASCEFSQVFAGLLALALAERHRGGTTQVQDFTLRSLGRTDEAQAAKYVVMAKVGIQRAVVQQAIEDGHDLGLRAHRRCDGRDRTVQIVGLAAQQHQVERFFPRQGVEPFGHDMGNREIRISQRTADLQTLRFKLRGTHRTHQEGYVRAGLRQASTEVSACPTST